MGMEKNEVPIHETRHGSRWLLCQRRRLMLTAGCAPLCLSFWAPSVALWPWRFMWEQSANVVEGSPSRPPPWSCTADVTDNHTVATARPTLDADWE
jgi:hypothetical protein